MDEDLLQSGWESRMVRLADVELHCVVAGEGPLLVFLHGWPEFWFSWREQIAEFSKDFKVVVPDLRGFNHSSKPAGVDPYEMSKLTRDVADLIGAFGREQAIVAGHDWGAIIAWRFAEEYPRLTAKLISLSIPHLKVFADVHRKSSAMRAATVHFKLFQPSGVPEFLLSRGRYFMIRNLFRVAAVNFDNIKSDLSSYIQAVARPGVLTATLNYYRANLNTRRLYKLMDTGSIECPVLLLYGEGDKIWPMDLIRALPDTEQYVSAGFEWRSIPSAGHWLQVEAPEAVNQSISAFIR